MFEFKRQLTAGNDKALDAVINGACVGTLSASVRGNNSKIALTDKHKAKIAKEIRCRRVAMIFII